MRRSITYSWIGAMVLAGSAQVPRMEPVVSPLSSVVVHSQSRRPKEVPKIAKVLFVGDIMFDRQIRTIAESKGYEHILSCLVDDFAQYDAVIGNLEGPITEYASVSTHTRVGDVHNTQFTFSPDIVPVLKHAGFKAVSLGNNHIRDFGKEGTALTIHILSQGGMAYAGAPYDTAHAYTTLMLNGLPLAFVPYNQFLGSPDDTFIALAKIPRETVTVVFPHWGNEYQPASEEQKFLAKKFIASGADAVIGSHPHVVQEHEVVDGAPVFYSLGNFIFDQYWDDTVTSGMGVVLTINESGIIGVTERDFTIGRDGRTCTSDPTGLFPHE